MKNPAFVGLLLLVTLVSTVLRRMVPQPLDRLGSFVSIRSSNRKKKKKKILFFLHLHKSGGTTLCRMAEKNHLKSKYGGRNCLIQPDQRCCGNSDTKQAQIDFAETTIFQFVASEGDLYQHLVPTHYTYVVILRNSKDRYISQYRHIRQQASRVVDASEQVENDDEEEDDDETFVQWYKRQPDNWNTRKLCGTLCQDVPQFHLTSQHFHYTVNRLLHFFEILLLEDFHQSYQSFAHRHGWVLEAPVHQNPIPLPNEDDARHKTNDTTTSGASPPQQWSTEPDQEVWNPMMSRLDDVLYQLAVAQASRQTGDGGGGAPWILGPTRETRKLLQRSKRQLSEYYNYHQSPLAPNCTNPCCADECSQYRRP